MDLIYNENTQILLKINNINKDIWIFVMNLKKKIMTLYFVIKYLIDYRKHLTPDSPDYPDTIGECSIHMHDKEARILADGGRWSLSSRPGHSLNNYQQK